MNSRRWIRSGWRGPAQAERHVGLAHGEVELLVGQDQLDLDVRVEVEELADPRRQPEEPRPTVVVT